MKVVITGGPCAGKSSIVDALRQQLQQRVIVVPESATLLFEQGFPAPGLQVSVETWNQLYADLFQERAYELRLYLEETFEAIARREGISLIVCDRGILDGAAYVQGGRARFCSTYAIREQDALRRYDAVIHLESLATGIPSLYSRENNTYRRETVVEAARRERATQAAWADHPRYYMVSATETLAEKQDAVFGIIEHLMEEAVHSASSLSTANGSS